LALGQGLAAAALYAAFVAALLALSHRLIVRLTWRAALVLALLPLCFTGRALLTGRVYGPVDIAYASNPFAPYAAQYGMDGEHNGILTDLYSAFIPWHHAVRYAVQHGEWPLWNPFILCGDPLAGSAQPAPYYPVNVLSLLLALPFALTFAASAHLFLAALAAFLYLRDLGCREIPAVLGAVGWAFCSFLAFWLQWPVTPTVLLFPLVVLAARRVVLQPGWPSSLLLTVALTLAVLAGHPESTLHVVVLGAVLGLVEAASVPPRRWGAIAVWTAAGGALALALSAIFLLPLVEVLRQTAQWLYRQGALEMAKADPAADAWRHLVGSVVPSIDKMPLTQGPRPLLDPLASAYAGSVLWGPALYGLVRGPWRGRFVLAALGVIGVCAGAKMPGVYPVLGHLPLFSIALNDRLVFAGAFATVVLAALGVEAWLRAADAGEPKRATRELAGAYAAALLVYAAALIHLVPGSRAAGFAAPVVARWMAWSLAPLIAATLVVGLAAAPRLSRRPLLWAAALVLALTVQRTGEMGTYYPTAPARAFYPRVPPLDALPSQDGEPWRFAGQYYQMIPNQAGLYDLEDVRGYQAIFHRRFLELAPLWVSAKPIGWFLAVEDVNRPLLSLMNVRYVMTPQGRNLRRRRLVASGPQSLLWDNPRALPRAFVPRKVWLGVPPDQQIAEMKEEEDFGAHGWIEPPDGDAGPPRERRSGPGTVSTRRRGLGFVMTAEMAHRGWVIVTETAWTGWRARLDGREVPLGIGDHAFLALAVPRGTHHIELFYRPRSFELGLGASAAALALIATVSLLRAVRRKRAGVEQGGD
jgi:hypothetical protein